jgi:hypothetical protein
MRNNMMPPQGGLKMDGQIVDPVSGNEVPVGSNAQEVRDDIPAQLSQGEYVVPADIVRYYGVKFFEDLRNQGKGGLEHMAATGRIGGEPVPPGGPQAGPMGQPMMAEGGDLTPDEMNELRSLMNVGGMAMPMQQQPMTDPYQQQSAMYQQPRGAQYGGDFGGGSFYNNPQAITTPTRYTGEFSWERPSAPIPTGDAPGQPVTLYCPDGSVNTLQLPADQAKYDELIQNGCGLDQSILPTTPTDEGSESPTVRKPGDPDDPAPWTKKYGYPEVVVGEKYPDEVTSYQNILDASMNALTGEDDSALEAIFKNLLGGGALGKLTQGTTHAQVAANIAILTANLGNLTPDQQDQLKDLEKELARYRKANGLDMLPKEFINGDKLAIAASGKSYMTLLNRDSKDVFGKNIFDPTPQAKQGQAGAGAYEDYVNANNIQFETKAMNITAGNTRGFPDQKVSEQEGYDDLVAAAKASGNEEIITKVATAGDKTLTELIKETGGTGSLVDTSKQNLGQQDVVGATFKQGESILEKADGVQYNDDDDGGFTTTFSRKSKAEKQKAYEDVGGSAGGVSFADMMADYEKSGIKKVDTSKNVSNADKIVSAATSASKNDDTPTATTTTKSSTPIVTGETTKKIAGTNDKITVDVTAARTDDKGNKIVGSVSEGGQYAGDGFEWKENDGGYLTRVYTGANEGSTGSSDATSTTSSSDSGGCCFIMLEARYGNGTMDEVVRRYRDEYMTDRNRRGYYRLAEVLVPLMRKSKAFKWVITKTFADPLVSYGKYYYGQNKHGVLYSPVKNFWMKVFDIVGGDTKFIRENGEVV